MTDYPSLHMIIDGEKVGNLSYEEFEAKLNDALES